MEPERFTELTEIWERQLSLAEDEYGENIGLRWRNMDDHIKRAEVLIGMISANEHLLSTPLNEKLQSEPRPMLAIDSQGIVRGVNEAAASVFGVSEKSTIDQLPFGEDAISSIRGELSKITKPGQDGTANAIFRTYRLDNDAPAIISCRPWMTPGARNLLLLKTVDFAWPAKLTPIIRSAFELTEAEAKVMQLLAEGNSVSNISKLRHSSIATVRTQVRSIYNKTSTRNQNEFMRMALGLTTLDLLDKQSITGAFHAPSGNHSAPHPRPEERHLHSLPDGRLLDYAVFGATDGRPCLFVHSEFFGDGCTASMVRYARVNNLKIIAPARPHNGRSSPYPAGVKTYDQFGEDVLSLMDALSVQEFVILSQPMAGSLFSLMLGHNHPDRIKGIVFLAPIFPYGSVHDEKKMFPFHRYLSSIITRFPKFLEFSARAGIAYHNRVGTKRFFATFAEGRKEDLATLENEETFSAMAHGAKICGANGHEGFYNDYRCIPQDIEEKFLSLKMPIYTLIGGASPQGTSTKIRRMAEDMKNFEIFLIEGAAQYLCYSNPIEIVDCLLKISNENGSANQP